ncbi:hypothetical protein AJ78_07215 [Emergomyces pasteurianus Ep9510]|uniref:Uncharacterized protein n=1 Tax=Emergomyces pasteurianus Ep9510 TaxID=1447872 RepID=A0A1J9P6S8_9EURO|nr:hypothetical protein AJ78_07215 [Emergomyces pasteurianus Ep9510]
MACFCHKLLAENFSDITEAEAEILRRVFNKAHVFNNSLLEAGPDTTTSVQKPPKKRPKTSSDSSFGSTQGKDVSQGPPVDATQDLAAIASNLEKTYPNEKLEAILKSTVHHRIQEVPPQFAAAVNIILAIERSDQIIEVKQLSKRVSYYALAKLHPKGKSVDEIVEQVFENDKDIKRKVYHYLRLGNKWWTIVESVRSILSDILSTKLSETQVTGIFCVLRALSVWERASPEACSAALSALAKKDIYQRIKAFSPYVNSALRHISGTHTFIRHSYDSIGMVKLVPMCRRLHTASSPGSHWRASSTAAVSAALPELRGDRSEVGGLLLVLLCFLARSEVPLQLCVRGASPRKRWGEQGEIEETGPLNTGLVPELVHTFSNYTDLNNALCELQSFSAISKKPDNTCLLDSSVLNRVLCSLSPEFHSFWRLQALIIAFRSVSWKYLEPGPLDMKLFIPHLRHTLHEVRNHDGFQDLATNMRTDLILTLAEASRFPGMAWKRFAIDQAKELMRGLNDAYIQSCIAQRECLVYRTTGFMNEATNVIDSCPGPGQLPVVANKNVHAGFGQSAIQRALNYIQVDELAMATDVLDAWQPFGRIPAAIEEVVLFRKHVILGKVLRFQGKFRESLLNLEKSKNLADRCHDLFFNEDRCDLMCNLADTLRELERPANAEHCLRTEIARQNQVSRPDLLKLALAECLFAQGRYAEVETICSEVKSKPNLLKMEKMRLAITRAKVFHINSDWEGAFQCWTEAMQAVDKFTLTKGRTTRTILLSICDILRRQGQHELELKSRDQLATLEKLAGTGGSLYWIAGLRHWLDHLQTSNRPRI